MIFTSKQQEFSLVSVWSCKAFMHFAEVQWTYNQSPTTDTRTVSFDVSLPGDAAITRAWMTMDLSSPYTGCAVRKVNDISIPSDGVVELPIDGLNASTSQYKATFAFRANGAIIQDANQHQGSLTISNLALNIAYSSVSNPDDGGDDNGQEEDVVISVASEKLQLPRLLDENFREVARIYPTNLQLQIKVDPLSGAVMRTSLNEPEVKVGDFLELFSPHGSVGLFRAKEVETSCGGAGERTIYMEHAVGTLADSLAIGAQTMSGPVSTIFSTLLESQIDPLWAMGDCEVPEDYELIYEYSSDNLLQAITGLTAELPPDYMWQFETIRKPFLMHLRKLGTERSCEARLNRNVTSAKITVDRSKMCTRVIPYGAGEGTDRMTLTPLVGALYLDSPTAEEWGYVARRVIADDIYDAPTLKIFAERYLDRYGKPFVSVTVSAVDLAKATGEELDYFQPGALCCLALPAYGTTMQERVTEVKWRNVFGNPKDVQVLLANRVRDASDEIAELMRETTNIKLFGGKVETIEETGGYGSNTPTSFYTQYFDVTGYGNLISVVVSYKCVTSSYAEVDCNLYVDGVQIDGQAGVRTVDITRWLSADESGVPIVGEHRVAYQPKTANNVYSSISTTLTVKQIKKG